jgi:hypothetical protein
MGSPKVFEMSKTTQYVHCGFNQLLTTRITLTRYPKVAFPCEVLALILEEALFNLLQALLEKRCPSNAAFEQYGRIRRTCRFFKQHVEQISQFPKASFARDKRTIILFWPDCSPILSYDNEKEIIPCWSWDQIFQIYQRLLFRSYYGDRDWDGDLQMDLNEIVKRIGNFWKNPFLSLRDIELLMFEEDECYWRLNLGRFFEYQIGRSRPGVGDVRWRGTEAEQSKDPDSDDLPFNLHPYDARNIGPGITVGEDVIYSVEKWAALDDHRVSSDSLAPEGLRWWLWQCDPSECFEGYLSTYHRDRAWVFDARDRVLVFRTGTGRCLRKTLALGKEITEESFCSRQC